MNPNFIDRFEAKVSILGSRTALTHVKTSEEAQGLRASQSVSYEELRRRALSIAVALEDIAKPGDRVLLLADTGPDFLSSFLGCIYAGMIVVPVNLPTTVPATSRLEAITINARPTAILTSSRVLASIRKFAEQIFLKNQIIAVDELQVCKDESFNYKKTTLALLQYTSGSTGNPRGVMVSQENLLANIDAMNVCYSLGSSDRQVTWLPPYHSTGLIRGLLQPILSGLDVIVLEPELFVRDPFCWLSCYDTFKATYGGAPNFAYRLCVEHAKKYSLAANLSSWRVATCGAEPIQHATLIEFEKTFEINGFRRGVITPGYGLSEATLNVASRKLGTPIQSARLNENGRYYWEHSASLTDQHNNRASVVAVGEVLQHTQIVIVDPNTNQVQESGKSGEIWISGPSIAVGYWENEEVTREIFGAVLNNTKDTRKWLRTGDLGFFLDDQLFIAGRIKEMLIFRGQNIYPQDIEFTAANAHPSLKEIQIIVSSVTDKQVEAAVMVIEYGATISPVDIDRLCNAIRVRVAEVHGISIREIAFVEKGQIQRTVSGKLRRGATRDEYLAGRLNLHGVSKLTTSIAKAEAADNSLVSKISQIFGVVLSIDNVTADTNFFAVGGDSLMLIEMVSILEDELGIIIESDIVSTFPTPSELASVIELKPSITTPPDAILLRQMKKAVLAPIIKTIDKNELELLSPIQRRWAHNYLVDRRRSWGNISWSFSTPFRLTQETLYKAAHVVWGRYDSLRMNFPGSGADVRQVLSTNDGFSIKKIEFQGDDELEVKLHAVNIAQHDAKILFDLEADQLTRFTLIENDRQTTTIVATTHHMVTDGWSIGIIDKELRRECARQLGLIEDATNKQDQQISYRDYAFWYRNLEKSGLLDASRGYWRNELAGAPMTSPSLRVSNEYRGRSVRVSIDSSSKKLLEQLTAAGSVTTATIVMSAFFSALHHLLQIDDLVIGTPLAGRDRHDLRDAVGMYINNVPIRLKGANFNSLNDTLAGVKKKMMSAILHQRWQLDLMAEDCGWNGDMSIDFPFTNIFFTDMAVSGYANLDSQQISSKELPADVRFHMMLYSLKYSDHHVLDLRYRGSVFPDDLARLILEYVLNETSKLARQLM
jgi:acyl-CoA synthetase (AMP-forming)/AMP-acid ligase II/acyl carrier protein